MEQAVGMETALFGGPPELGNMLKLANGQIGFMTIFAHPLFSNVADIVPAMRFAADEILTNKGVWFTRADHEKRVQMLQKGARLGEGGSVSPRTRSPVGRRGAAENGKNKRSLLPSSPLRSRGDMPEEVEDVSGPKRGRRSGHGTPQDNSQPSSLAGAAGPFVPTDSPSHLSTSSKTSPSQKLLEDRSVSRSKGTDSGHVSNGHNCGGAHGGRDEAPNNSSTPRVSSSGGGLSPEDTQALSDKRRDTAISMRAGSEAIPAEALSVAKSETAQAEALSKFNFATSNADEPVRTYDPSQAYQAEHASGRASAPARPVTLGLAKDSAMEDARQTRSAQSGHTTSTTLRGGTEDSAFSPSQSTEATSYTSDKSVELVRNQGDYHQPVGTHAAGPPTPSATTELSPSFSMGSNSAASGDSNSKVDVHTTILSNGNVNEGHPGDRNAISKTLGRRRSRLKMGLAFWKRNRSSKSLGDGERPDSQGS